MSLAPVCLGGKDYRITYFMSVNIIHLNIEAEWCER